MYTVFSMAAVLFGLIALGNMSKDSYCDIGYTIPCFICIFMGSRQIFIAAIRWFEKDAADYYVDKYEKSKKYGYSVNGDSSASTYQHKKHHNHSTTYSSERWNDFDYQGYDYDKWKPKPKYNKEIIDKCVRNFTVKVED